MTECRKIRNGFCPCNYFKKNNEKCKICIYNSKLENNYEVTKEMKKKKKYWKYLGFEFD